MATPTTDPGDTVDLRDDRGQTDAELDLVDPRVRPDGELPPGGAVDLDEDRPRVIRARTFDDRAALVCSAAGSAGLVWILYERVLPLSGILGLVVAWYLTFLLVYGITLACTGPRARVVDGLWSVVVHGAALVAGLALFATVAFVFVRGWAALHHPNFYTQDMSGIRPTSPLTQGGIKHALLGTIIEVALAVAMALPLGIGTAVFMTEVGGRVADTVRTVVEAMTALPDILAGLFVYTVLIIGLHWERDGFAVSIALAVTMVPIIARSAEVALKVVPNNLREAGMALGATHWQTVRRVVLPTARAGLVTSLILGIARTAGETAPLLIVSGASTFTNTDPFHNPMNSLPLYIFTAVRSGEPLYEQRGYGAAALLLAVVLVLFAVTRLLARRRGALR